MTLPEAEVKAGLALQPQSLDISLIDRPINDLLFTQFIATVSGTVSCLGMFRFVLLIANHFCLFVHFMQLCAFRYATVQYGFKVFYKARLSSRDTTNIMDETQQ